MREFEEYDERANIERGELEGCAPFVVCVALLALSLFLGCL